MDAAAPFRTPRIDLTSRGNGSQMDAEAPSRDPKNHTIALQVALQSDARKRDLQCSDGPDRLQKGAADVSRDPKNHSIQV